MSGTGIPGVRKIALPTLRAASPQADMPYIGKHGHAGFLVRRPAAATPLSRRHAGRTI